jgi:nicotinate dehydrogenase subunit B
MNPTAGPATGYWTPSLDHNRRLGTWVTVCPDGRILARSGKVELGQGILTALAQIVADELDVDPSRVTMVPATTTDSPDESYTAGSLSVQHSGEALRLVCAEVRSLLVTEAAGRLGLPAASLDVVDGSVIGPGDACITYWELADAALLERDATGAAIPKPVVERRWVGRSVPRPDLTAKIAGRPAYVHDLRMDGQLYGRVVRPASPAAVLRRIDGDRVWAIAGVVAVEVDGSFVGVVANREEVAIRAARMLGDAIEWEEHVTLPDEQQLAEYQTTASATAEVLHDAAAGDGHSSRAVPVRTLSARFTRPYLAHSSIGPSCAVARWDPHPGGSTLRVWTHSQGIHNLRRALAASLGLEPDDVIVAHVDGAGCYGHNGADDAALDAALLARVVPGRPVQVLWSREDELSWSPLAPAMVVDVTVEVGADGAPLSWKHEIWGNGHSSRPWSPGRPPLLAARHRADAAPAVAAGDPPMGNGGGSGRNSVPWYRAGSVEVVSHLLQAMPLRTSAMRALGAHLNVYAIEQVIDELAVDAGVDPVAFRLSLMADERARAVVEAAAEAGGWEHGLPGGTTGRGVGCARYKHVGAYCAVVAEVEAEREVRVIRLSIAADVGAPVNPEGVVSQLEGGALQAISWTLKERVRFDRIRVTSRTWEDYPILTFSEVPAVEVVLVGDSRAAPLGAGEASIGPTAAAIGNAVAAALGLRIRDLPLTAANIVAAIG